MSSPDPAPPSVGRLRAAWYVLMGRRMSSLQMEVEWLEYKMIFEDILSRLGAQLARSAKSQKRQLAANLSEQLEQPAATGRGGSKGRLRRKIAIMKGVPGVHPEGAPARVVEEPVVEES